MCHVRMGWVSGDTLDKELELAKNGAYYAVLFYAPWCPFSRSIRPIFDLLSSMFPETQHLVVEESSAMPSVFSRYGIHSFPSILLANRTARIKYHGSKDIDSLAKLRLLIFQWTNPRRRPTLFSLGRDQLENS
ncbi:hypothetical protein HPP92_007948 [Vanilla planifolia]|uniref:Thioredoxin domain-containing protein n=1 Tax=Vanilla planifolia TaxID=51239 RepID=A0A835RNF4_VANPL|nr:hypothetical protein HPP92_007948 [Vanilla planifolia]